MPTTFDVLYLGNFASIDPIEGNINAENASVLVGETTCRAGTPLYDNIQLLTLETTGCAGGNHSYFDQNHKADQWL